MNIIKVIMSRKVFQYSIVAIGCLLGAIGINAISVPNHFYSGGISGIALIFYYIFGWPVGLQIFLANVPLLYAAYRQLGKEYTLVAVWGTAVFSFFIDMTSRISNPNLIDDPMLAAIVAGVISGISSGLIFRVNGSGGGLDIVSAIVKKAYSINMGFAGLYV